MVLKRILCLIPESKVRCVEITGHRYGSTLVPFSAEDKDAMKYKTEKCFKMLGFTKAENVCACSMPLSLMLDDCLLLKP